MGGRGSHSLSAKVKRYEMPPTRIWGLKTIPNTNIPSQMPNTLCQIPNSPSYSSSSASATSWLFGSRRDRGGGEEEGLWQKFYEIGILELYPYSMASVHIHKWCVSTFRKYTLPALSQLPQRTLHLMPSTGVANPDTHINIPSYEAIDTVVDR